MTPLEGYVLASYGPHRYLRHAVASAQSIRRQDGRRPIALLCSPEHAAILAEARLAPLFAHVEVLPHEHRSIVGVKHHLHRFMPFDRNLFADSDVLWCRNPDDLWRQLSAYPFTAAGDVRADVWFGAAKDLRIVGDLLLFRRKRTLRRLGLTHLPRVLSALVYAQDRSVTEEICIRAQRFLSQRHLTHFRSRLGERGRTLESCEWSLALAMSARGAPVFPWHRAADTPLVDYYPHTTDHDEDFTSVTYRLWRDRTVYDVQGLPSPALRRALTAALTRIPQWSEYVRFTPLMLHFGELPFKQPFYDFADRTWQRLTAPRV